jgi:hypothetical protein
MNDLPIRIPTETFTPEVWLPQSNVDGLYALINWLAGFTAGSNTGMVPGHHELIMHYRQLSTAVGNSKA